MKLLIVNTCGLGTGGITTHMINYLGQIDKAIEKTATATILFDQEMIKQLQETGTNIIYMPDRKRNPLGYIRAMKKLIAKERYDVIHVHGNSATMVLELQIAKKYGVPVRIAHCHTMQCGHPVIHRLLKRQFESSYTKAIACSLKAGSWIFGEGNYWVLPNAIPCEKYYYQEEVRRAYRRELNLSDDTLLLGHVGYFCENKNQSFLVDLLAELKKTVKAELVLIGQGEEEEFIKKRVKQQGMEDMVHFLGLRSDVNSLLQAMDIFLLPSKWEGLPLVLVEAQAAGLPCIFSDNVSGEACLLSDRCYQIPLDLSVWIQQIEVISRLQIDRADGKTVAETYDVKKLVPRLLEIYEGKI